MRGGSINIQRSIQVLTMMLSFLLVVEIELQIYESECQIAVFYLVPYPLSLNDVVNERSRETGPSTFWVKLSKTSEFRDRRTRSLWPSREMKAVRSSHNVSGRLWRPAQSSVIKPVDRSNTIIPTS